MAVSRMFGDYMKTLYQVTINWKGEIHHLYSQASTKHKALHNCIRQLAIGLGISNSYVRNYILEDGKDRYTIK